jgi:hypothetical protein
METGLSIKPVIEERPIRRPSLAHITEYKKRMPVIA